MRTVLGLDLGTSSVGWALFELDVEGEPWRLVDLGVRHFEEVTEPKTKELKNAKRRQARQMRKNLRRRRQRRDNILRALQDSGLVAAGENPFAESESDPYKPYEIRARAVSEAVTREELGRALFHLGKRRGFKSNRGAKLASLAKDSEASEFLAQAAEKDDSAKTDEEKEEGVVLESISKLRSEMGEQTLGQFFRDQIYDGERVRGRHTDRSMYEEEFEQIWSVQAPYHPTVLTDELKVRLGYAIFHQRPLRIQKYLKGKCSMEPRKVCAERAQLIAQRFRYWQDIANLEFTDPRTGERRRPDVEQRLSLAAYLENHGSMSWVAIRKELKLPKTFEINLQRSKKDGLKGNSTAARMAAKAPTHWSSLDEAGREQLVETVLTVEDRGVLFRTLRDKFGLIAREAYNLAILELDGGTASLSAKAMRKMLVHMMAGMSRQEAQEEAGYTPWTDEIEPLSRLPELPKREELPNPRVRKALGQVRKVVNAVIATYGKPEIIRIELARDLSLTKSEKLGREKANQANAKENKQAEEWFRNLKVENPSRKGKIWYRLAKQCGWVCPYTGAPIPQELSSLSRFTIEHIVPYSKCLDDSFNNLTLCDSETNAAKGNRTPFEAFGQTPEWQAMVYRVQSWKGYGGGQHKRKLFLREEMPPEDEMKERQLNETRHICRLAAQYLRPVCGQVQVTKGQATAMVRAHWGLMKAMSASSAKIRDDLRHHAVDAVAVAFTSLSLFQKATRIRKAATIEPLTKQTLPEVPAWLHHQLKERLRTVVISHEVTRGITGVFHDESRYGLRDPAKKEYHRRKDLVKMTRGEVERIVDDSLREKATTLLSLYEGDVSKAFVDGITVGSKRARRARYSQHFPNARLLAVPARAPISFVDASNYHHVEVFRRFRGDAFETRFVTIVEAAERARQKGAVRTESKPQWTRNGRRTKRRIGLPIVDVQPSGRNSEFFMWLAPNDTVRVAEADFEFYKVVSLEANDKRIVLRPLNQANPDRKTELRAVFASLNVVCKVEVDPIGRVREVREGVV